MSWVEALERRLAMYDARCHGIWQKHIVLIDYVRYNIAAIAITKICVVGSFIGDPTTANLRKSAPGWYDNYGISSFK